MCTNSWTFQAYKFMQKLTKWCNKNDRQCPPEIHEILGWWIRVLQRFLASSPLPNFTWLRNLLVVEANLDLVWRFFLLTSPHSLLRVLWSYLAMTEAILLCSCCPDFFFLAVSQPLCTSGDQECFACGRSASSVASFRMFAWILWKMAPSSLPTIIVPCLSPKSSSMTFLSGFRKRIWERESNGGP